MPSENNPGPFGPGGFDFEQLRKLMEQMGLGGAGQVDFEQLMGQLARWQQSGAGGAFGFGVTNADLDPDAAWRTTMTAARSLAEEKGPDPALESFERSSIVDAERLAQSWLGDHTSFPETGIPVEALRRGQWLEQTASGWRAIVEPIIDGLASALERGAGQEQEDELAALSAMLAPMMRTSASLVYRDRLKRVLSDVATSTLTGTEIGINLLPRATVAVLPSNVADFTRDLELPESDVMIHLLVREAARQRLFHHVGWLSPQLTALLAHYAREISIDFESLSQHFDPESLEGMSFEDVMAVGEQVRGSFFKPASTPAQLEILGRLEVLLALIEGWVDHVSARASGAWLPTTSQLVEVVRRRRASGGPTQEVFGDLLGLHLRPRLVRDAENLWAAIEHARGASGRDDVWRHPDLLPTATHLEDPLSYRGEPGAPEPDDLDRELQRILDEGNQTD